MDDDEYQRIVKQRLRETRIFLLVNVSIVVAWVLIAAIAIIAAGGR